MLPDFLCHYYDESTGPFRSLTDLDPLAAEALQALIRADRPTFFASRRRPDYVGIRRELEARVRALFAEKGGRPKRQTPLYAVLGTCPWLLTWYPNGRELRLPISLFRSDAVSFTYGDTFPAMRLEDGKPFRRRVYTLDELPALVGEFGLPQEVNPEGALGPERYVEAQIWDDEPLKSIGVLTGG